MKPKEFQELLDFIASSGLAEVSIETEQFKVKVKREPSSTHILPQMGVVSSSHHPVVAPNPPVLVSSTTAPEAVKVQEKPAPTENHVTIKSPMIGTFYRSASPDSDMFVNVGDTISSGQTVCIIEAMKLFNEIESEISGRIVKILVENATPVEYDQPLFLVDLG
jgi:acetyl-CoA carboxylase biotin carboxyl carrier protein